MRAPLETALPESNGSTASLLGEIIADAQKLVRQELSLAKVEVKGEWTKAKRSLLDLGVAWMVLGVGVLLSSFALVHGMTVLTGFPLWAGFGLVALLALGAGLLLYKEAKRKLEEVSLVPQQTVNSVKENVQWIRSRT
jgi:multidrug transporter EmrE-like cation transporter